MNELDEIVKKIVSLRIELAYSTAIINLLEENKNHWDYQQLVWEKVEKLRENGVINSNKTI